jgi:hypothetical protein
VTTLNTQAAHVGPELGELQRRQRRLLAGLTINTLPAAARAAFRRRRAEVERADARDHAERSRTV